MFRARYHNNVTTGKRDSTHCFIIFCTTINPQDFFHRCTKCEVMTRFTVLPNGFLIILFKAIVVV